MSTVSSGSTDSSYKNLEQAIQQWNKTHPTQLLNSTTAKTIGIGTKVFVEYSDQRGYRIIEADAVDDSNSDLSSRTIVVDDTLPPIILPKYQDKNVQKKIEYLLWEYFGDEFLHLYLAHKNNSSLTYSSDEMIRTDGSILRSCRHKYEILKDAKDYDKRRAALEFKSLDQILREKYVQYLSSENFDDLRDPFVFKIYSILSNPAAYISDEELLEVERSMPEIERRLKETSPDILKYIKERISFLRKNFDSFHRDKLRENMPKGIMSHVFSLLGIRHEAPDVSIRVRLERDAEIDRIGNIYRLYVAKVLDHTWVEPSLYREGVYVKDTSASLLEDMISFSKAKTYSDDDRRQIDEAIRQLKLIQDTSSYDFDRNSKILADQIDALRPATKKLRTAVPFAGGFSAHAVIFYIVKTSENPPLYCLKVINTGTGSRFVWKRMLKFKSKTLVFEDLTKEQLSRDVIRELLCFKEQGEENTFIEFIEKLLKKKVKAIGAEHSVQGKGTCATRCILAASHETLDDLYADFYCHMTDRAIHTLEETMSKVSDSVFSSIFKGSLNRDTHHKYLLAAGHKVAKKRAEHLRVKLAKRVDSSSQTTSASSSQTTSSSSSQTTSSSSSSTQT